MKKWLVVVLVLAMSGVCYGAAIDFAVEGTRMRTTDPNYMVTSNTVSFNTVATVVTFNTAINEITFVNESSASPVHVSLTPSTSLDVKVQSSSSIGAFKLASGASVTIPVKTSKIGFITTATNSGYLNYIAVSESTTQP